MVMELNTTRVNLREQEEFKGTQTNEEEEDQDAMQEISITKFVKKTRRKEQVEGGKSGEKSHNNGGNVGKDKNSKHPPNDSPPQQHSPMTDHYQSYVCFPFATSKQELFLQHLMQKLLGSNPVV